MPIDPPNELRRGYRLLDRYAVGERVAGGGMATIYRAFDERLQRDVCVKLLRLELEGSGSTNGGRVYKATYSHFLQEALALSRLQHPNTLRIFDFGYLSEGGRPFQISEFLEGGTLEDRVAERGTWSIADCVSLLERITGAVEEAHEHGIVHRDIKPSNILFGKVGGQFIPKLADFGIADADLRPKGSPDLTGSISSVALFSPRWAAPEQLSGMPQGPATDIYALGLVIAFALTGKPLFEGRDVRPTFQQRISSDELVSRLMAIHGVPEPARPVLLRALASQANQRFRTPTEFYFALRAVSLSTAGSSATSAPITPDSTADALMGRTVRSLETTERADLVVTVRGKEVRFRATFVPSGGGERTYRIQLKGLNCFMRPTGGRPTTAVNVDKDGLYEFVSAGQELLGPIACSFGREDPSGIVFRTGSGEMVVPRARGTEAVAFYFGADQEVVVMYRLV